MHLALLIYETLETLSGGYLYDRQLTQHLRANGDKVDIISLPWRNYAAHLSDNLSFELLHKLQTGGWDALMQDELNHPSLFWLNRRLKAQVDYPILSIVHHLRASEDHPPLLRRLYRVIERLYLQTIDGFIFNSQTTRAVVSALLGSNTHSQVAYPAGDRFDPTITETEICNRSMQPGPLRILFIGNLIPRKGLHTLLKAVELLPPEVEWRLEIAGGHAANPEYTVQMRAAAQNGGLLPRVEFLGAIPDRELADRLRTSQLLVVPSSYEGFGIVYLEGMSFGLPAIAGDQGAASELINPDENGFLVTPGDAENLARLLERLGRDRRLLARLSLGARQRYLQHPTWTSSMSEARAFIHDTISRNRA